VLAAKRHRRGDKIIAIAGLSSARARGRSGGRPYTMTPAKLRLAQAAMAKCDTKVSDLCTELGITRQTLYRFVGPNGELRADATKLLNRKAQTSAHEGAQDQQSTPGSIDRLDLRLAKDLGVFVLTAVFVSAIYYLAFVTATSVTATPEEKKWTMSVLSARAAGLVGYLVHK
jgi:hypothetical protein